MGICVHPIAPLDEHQQEAGEELAELPNGEKRQ